MANRKLTKREARSLKVANALEQMLGDMDECVDYWLWSIIDDMPLTEQLEALLETVQRYLEFQSRQAEQREQQTEVDA